jgi:hypothetical protein
VDFDEIKMRWEKLRDWQKGAVIGSIFHISSVLIIYISVLIFVPVSSPPGAGDMGPGSALGFASLSVLIEIIPTLFLYPVTGTMGTVILAYSGPFGGLKAIIAWFLYMIYSTIVYAFMGILLIKIIRWLISKEPQVKSNS